MFEEQEKEKTLFFLNSFIILRHVSFDNHLNQFFALKVKLKYQFRTHAKFFLCQVQGNINIFDCKYISASFQRFQLLQKHFVKLICPLVRLCLCLSYVYSYIPKFHLHVEIFDY